MSECTVCGGRGWYVVDEELALGQWCACDEGEVARREAEEQLRLESAQTDDE